MACSVCKDPKHNSKTCTNQKQAFIDKWKGRWDEFHDALIECVKEVITAKPQPLPLNVDQHLWSFFLGSTNGLSTYNNVIDQKVNYDLPCSPLEIAVWRHHAIKNCFWDSRLPNVFGKGFRHNGTSIFRATATQSEIEAYEDLTRFSWDAVYAESSSPSPVN